MYRYDWPRGRPFVNSGTTARCPHLSMDLLQLRNREELQEQRTTYDLLKPDETIQPILNQFIFANNRNENIEKDLEWRKIHLGRPLGFWDAVATDIPYQMSDGVALPAFSPVRAGSLGNEKRELDPTMLPKHQQFENSQLVRNVFRTWHRSDGEALFQSVQTDDSVTDDFNRVPVDNEFRKRNRLYYPRYADIYRRFPRDNLQQPARLSHGSSSLAFRDNRDTDLAQRQRRVVSHLSGDRTCSDTAQHA